MKYVTRFMTRDSLVRMATVPALFVIQRMLKFTGRHAGGSFKYTGKILGIVKIE